ncbi:MAG: tetratricopeptide repeat protein [Bacteroidetes bacterium]|nr:tetratricopeptide repeat protein [Bacteroidota bacterium]
MMRFLFLFSLFMQLQYPSPCASQSLDNGLIWMLQDTVKINALIDSGWKANYTSPKEALRLAEEALLIANDLMRDREKTKALLLIAKTYDYFGKYKEALQLNCQALILSRRTIDKISEANALRQIGGMYQALCNYPEAIEYLQSSISLSTKIGYLKGTASALSDLGLVYRWKSDYKKSIECYFKSIAIKNRIGDKKNAATSYSNIANVFLEQNDYEQAIEYQLKGLRIREEINDVWGLTQSYTVLGSIKLLLNDFSNALEYMQKCLQLSIKYSYNSHIPTQIANIGLVYDKLGKHSIALKYHRRALKQQIELENKEGISVACANIGNSFSYLQEYDSAAVFLKKGLYFDSLLENNINVIDDYIALGSINIKRADFATASKYSEKAQRYLIENPSLNQSRDLAELQSQLFEKQGNYKASLTAYKQFISLRDSAINQNKKVAVALKEAKYEFDKKALADSLKNNEAQKAKDLQIKFKDSELQKHKLKQNAMLAGIVVLFVLGWLLYSRYKAVSLQQVSERKLMLLEKEQALVEERTRIADEMHDDVGADLSNLLLKIRMNEHLQTQSASPAVDLGGLKNSTNGIIHKIDEIIWSLNSHRDTLQELVNFIVKYYDSILKENNLSGKADVQETLPAIQMAAKQRRNIYLTVKEILNNVLKHAQANSIQLKVGFENNILAIKVCDDGNGFDTEKTYQGNGLRNISKRLEMMGGKLEIESMQNVGSTFLLHIPVV